jgi:hypothetical protein
VDWQREDKPTPKHSAGTPAHDLSVPTARRFKYSTRFARLDDEKQCTFQPKVLKNSLYAESKGTDEDGEAKELDEFKFTRRQEAWATKTRSELRGKRGRKAVMSRFAARTVSTRATSEIMKPYSLGRYVPSASWRTARQSIKSPALCGACARPPLLTSRGPGVRRVH